MALEKFQIKGRPTCKICFVKTLFEKQAVKGTDGALKYSASLYVPKTDTAKINQIDAQYDLAFQELRGKGAKVKTTDGLDPKNQVWIDGDVWADKDDRNEWMRGGKILKFSSRNFPPLICDSDGLIITNGYPSREPMEKRSTVELSEGDVCVVNAQFWTYCGAFTGIGCNFNLVQKWYDGDPLVGRSTNVKDFIEEEDWMNDERSAADDLPF